MKKSNRALLGILVLDSLILAGAGWLVFQIRTGAIQTTVPPVEAITTITSSAGGAIGVITVLLLVAFVVHRRRGN
jgi:hypothetical protein